MKKKRKQRVSYDYTADQENTEKLKQYIKDEYRKTQKLPTVETCAMAFNLTRQKTVELLRVLVAQGFIKRNNTRYGIQEEQEEKKIPFFQKFFKKQDKEEIKPLQKLNNGWNWIEVFVRVIMVIVAADAIYISSAASLDLTTVIFDDTIKALMLSLGIPMYTSFAPEGAILLYKAGTRMAKVAARIVIVTAIIALLFDLSMITFSQYSKRVDMIYQHETSLQDTNKSKNEYNESKSQETEKKKSIAQLQNQIEIDQKALAKFTEKEDMKTNEYKNLSWKITVNQNNITVKEKELKTITDKIDKIVGSKEYSVNTEIKKDFFSSLPGFVMFIIYLLPAIFCTLIAPLGVFVGLGLWKQNMNKEEVK
jgi:hypothetical protein